MCLTSTQYKQNCIRYFYTKAFCPTTLPQPYKEIKILQLYGKSVFP